MSSESFIDLSFFSALSSPIYVPRKIPCSVRDLLTSADSNPGLSGLEVEPGRQRGLLTEPKEASVSPACGFSVHLTRSGNISVLLLLLSHNAPCFPECTLSCTALQGGNNTHKRRQIKTLCLTCKDSLKKKLADNDGGQGCDWSLIFLPPATK